MMTFFQNLKKKPISLIVFNLLLAIWLGVFLNIAFFEKIHMLTPYNGVKAGLFVVASIIIVVAAYNFIFQLLTGNGQQNLWRLHWYLLAVLPLMQ